MAETLAYQEMREQADDAAKAQRRRAAGGVASTVGLDIPRPPGRLRRLLGW